MNGAEIQKTEEEAHVADRGSLDFSDEEPQEEHSGDYSARFEELMSDSEDEEAPHSPAHQDDNDDDEGFIYNGEDAEPTGGYREQLRDLLGSEHEEDELSEAEVERSLIQESAENEKFAALIEDEAGHVEMLSDHTPSVSPMPHLSALPPHKMVAPNSAHTPSSMSHPFLHPTISRLRSATPQGSRVPSSGSVGTLWSHAHEGVSAAPSHFSALSRTSSLTNISVGHGHTDRSNGKSAPAREIFRWTQLRVVGEHIYNLQPQKAADLLGTENAGSPTVLAANGLICVGTDAGRVLVFDFKQNLQCICGSDAPDKVVGAVTALALSFDHTFVASGHSTGHIQLFDIHAPKTPARFVAPTTLAAVASGRQEGHLVGSRIVNVGFVAGRHTAIVSADDSGLAFYHSLGKVLFMDAADTLRILGKYPDDGPVPAAPGHFRRRKSRKGSSILAMAPLPLGTSSHSTDQYNLVALLTPIKLVIVGLKPTPKTWYRRHRETDEDVLPKARFKGALAWFPSVVPGAHSPPARNSKSNGHTTHNTTAPMLVYSWGNTMSLVRVTESRDIQQTRNAKSGKVSNVEVGRVVFEEVGTWTAAGDVLAIQWLNVNQIIVLTPGALEVYDVRTAKLVEHAPFDAWSLVSPILSHTTNGTVSYSDAITEVAHSFRVYKGKMFLLGQHEVQVGTLLTWADRILSSVQNGDFLSAIELTRSYYVGEAPGNRNGLPDTQEQLKEVVGEKMRELMTASARYAFSEDRLTDATHITPDGRGVDRTSLFEGLVKACARASIALDDFDFFFEELFQYYDDNCISGIFLLQLEPFVLDSSIRHVPPRITQRLIALHEEDNHPDLAERLIWHIDPDCLDISQAITLCQNHHMYDALIYVFTRAVKDYESPMVELLALIRRVQQYRRTRNEVSSPADSEDDDAIEPVVLNAYKIYPYLADVLSGLTFPSEEPLPQEEAFQAKNDVYNFLFFGRSKVWPSGEGGKLILTSDEENGVEPTYPYARLLLRFDPEAFLHTLDLAFEDAYLNDKTRAVNRLVIIKILLEILTSPGLSSAEITFVHIFIARNVTIYSQFIQIPPSALQNVLIGLAEDTDQNTREDRQLAAEYLLSGYTPHDSDRIMALFEEAGFYRILRSWYQQESRWSPLLLTYLRDPDLPPSSVFPSIDDVLTTASRPNKGALPHELLATLIDSIPGLLAISVVSTAALLDKHQPTLHERALEDLGHEDEHRFAYLRYLLGSPQTGEEYGIHPFRKGGPSLAIPTSLRQLYVTLHCRFDPSGVVEALSYLPSDFLNAAGLIQVCEEHEVFDAAIWIVDREGDPQTALSKAETFEKLLSTRVADQLVGPDTESEQRIQGTISALEAIGRTTVSSCLKHSHPNSSMEVPLEDIWFQLLRGQIDSVHRVAGCCSPEALDVTLEGTSYRIDFERRTLAALRSLVQGTFTSLMSISSTKAVSFPRLFKRLVESTSDSHASKRTLYSEFRTILTGMLESFRSEGDMLVITKHLVDRDLFVTIEEFAQERIRGWAPAQGACRTCGESLIHSKASSEGGDSEPRSRVPIVVSRTGAIYHRKCLPPD